MRYVACGGGDEVASEEGREAEWKWEAWVSVRGGDEDDGERLQGSTVEKTKEIEQL